MLFYGKPLKHKMLKDDKYFLADSFDKNVFYEVSEKQFHSVISLNDDLLSIRCDENDFHRLNFFSGDKIIGYRIRYVY